MLTTTLVFLRSHRRVFGRDGHPALKCNPDGLVQANTFGEAKEWEEWTLCNVETEQEEKTFIALKSWSGKYLSAKPDGSVCADADKIGDWEKWKVCSDGKGGFVSFKSHFETYLTCDGRHNNCGNSVTANRKEAKQWEEWFIVVDRNAMTNPGGMKRAVLGTVTAVGSIVTVGALAVPLAGFGAGGVAAGSIAAGVQSAVYGGATCGAFSVLQSVGATLAWVPVAAAGGTTAAASGVALSKQKDKK